MAFPCNNLADQPHDGVAIYDSELATDLLSTGAAFRLEDGIDIDGVVQDLDSTS
jgi:hypothetical protein